MFRGTIPRPFFASQPASSSFIVWLFYENGSFRFQIRIFAPSPGSLAVFFKNRLCGLSHHLVQRRPLPESSPDI
jgi:hypothetical protein